MRSKSQKRDFAELVLIVALTVSAGPAGAVHETRAETVEGQYVLSLNLAALDSALTLDSVDPSSFIARHCPEGLVPSTDPEADGSPGVEPSPDATRQWLGREREPGGKGPGTPRARQAVLRLARECWEAIFPERPAPGERTPRFVGSILAPLPPEEITTGILLELGAEERRELADRLSRLYPVELSIDGGIESEPLFVLQPNYLLRASGPPTDPLLHAQWSLHRTRIPQAWERGYLGKSSVIVAVIDSGIDPLQVELQGNLWQGNQWPPGPGRSFCASRGAGCDPRDLTDLSGHGTTMAGIIGARTNDRLRVAGSNWHVSLMILKVLDEENLGSMWDVGAAIQFAAENGARILSLSLGGRAETPEPLIELLDAIYVASAWGSLVVAAAGNGNLDLSDPANVFYPPSFKAQIVCIPGGWCLDNLLVVGATDLSPESLGTPRWDRKASFSNYGTDVVDIGAPGVGVLSTGLETGWGVDEVTGSSAAAALVAGVAALVEASRTPACDPASQFCYEDLRRLLLDGANRVRALCDYFDKGRRLNAYRSVRRWDPPATERCP